MALRGNLNDFSLPDVFQLVALSRKTGVLRIERVDGAEGSVWFREGEVFFAQSNWHAALLGERLVRAQRVTPQALERALEIRGSEGPDGRRLGEILTDEGYISHAVLETFVQEQIQETIFDLMRWDDGEFDFEAMPTVAEEDIGLSISIENVIMEGSRRLDEWARIKKKIPSMDVVFKMATAPGEGTFEISLKPIEWNLLLLVDGTRSVAEMARETSRTDFDVARIVYGLFSAGLLEFTGDDEVLRLRAEKRERGAAVTAARAKRRAAQNAPDEPVAIDLPATIAPLPAEKPAEAERTKEPMLYGWELPGPSVEDAAVLEEMMGAVLGHPKMQDLATPESPDGARGGKPESPEPIVWDLELPDKEPLEPEYAESQPAELVEPATVQPRVPDLDLPLIRVMSPDALTDSAPVEDTSQTLEQALMAVAEAASAGLDQAAIVEPTELASGLADVPATTDLDEAESSELVAPDVPSVEPEFVWEPAPTAEPEPGPEPEPAPEPEPEPNPSPNPSPSRNRSPSPNPRRNPNPSPNPSPNRSRNPRLNPTPSLWLSPQAFRPPVLP